MAQYKDQSAADLRLHLLSGSSFAGGFDVLEADRLQRGTFSVRAEIIGASHNICFEMKHGPRLQEVLAGAKLADAPGVLFAGPIAEVPVRLSVELGSGPLGSVSYQFRPWLSRGDQAPAELARLEERIALASQRGDEIGLRFEFPVRQGSAEAARTLVWCGGAEGNDGLRVETAHSYPHESTVVFSSSRLALGRGRE